MAGGLHHASSDKIYLSASLTLEVEMWEVLDSIVIENLVVV